jgi:hypothetical protein
MMKEHEHEWYTAEQYDELKEKYVQLQKKHEQLKKEIAVEIFDKLDCMLHWAGDSGDEGTEELIDCLIIKYEYEELKEKYTGIKPKFPRKKLSEVD